MSVQRDLLKCRQKNTTASFRTLVKSHRPKKNGISRSTDVFEKRWALKPHKSHTKETVMKSFF